MTAPTGPAILTLDGAAAGPWARGVHTCFAAVFADTPAYDAWRAEVLDRHRLRDDFRLVVAGAPEHVVGFAWSYVGHRGEYFADLVAAALGPVAGDWIGGHREVVELAVLPEARGTGLGRALLETLLDGETRPCLLATTDDTDDPAVRLYRSAGWQRLGTLGPGRQVMGRSGSEAQHLPDR